MFRDVVLCKSPECDRSEQPSCPTVLAADPFQASSSGTKNRATTARLTPSHLVGSLSPQGPPATQVAPWESQKAREAAPLGSLVIPLERGPQSPPEVPQSPWLTSHLPPQTTHLKEKCQSSLRVEKKRSKLLQVQLGPPMPP